MSPSVHLRSILSFILFIYFSRYGNSSYPYSSEIGFSIPVIHFDSPESPLYNLNASGFNHLKETYRRTIPQPQQPSKIFPNFDFPYSKSYGVVHPFNTGLYLMRYEIGSPAREIFGIVDTGNHVTWLQCKPCKTCYKQKLPIFNPNNSYTFQKIPCSDSRCKLIDKTCFSNNGDCNYHNQYGDGSHSDGIIGTESFTLLSESSNTKKHRFDNIVFGCGYDNGGSFKEDHMGVIGFNAHPLSLISQLPITRFSHCFPSIEDKNLRGYINFGENAILCGRNTTMIVHNSFYYIDPLGISVGADVLKIPQNALTLKPDGTGGFITDTGTTFTMLRREVFDVLVNAIVNKAQLPRAKRKNDTFDLCFVVKNEQDLQRLPNITLHLPNISWTWSFRHTYIQERKYLLCLAVMPYDRFSILGSFQMQNIMMGYDLKEKLLYMACSPKCNRIQDIN